MGSQRAVRAQVVVALLAIATPRAFADAKQDAQEHVAKASGLHQAGKYREALGELTTAYELDPQPGLLYAIAQVHVKLDECAIAIDYYEQFLATHPDAKPSAAAHEAIDACKTVVAKQPPKPKPIEPKPVEHKPATVATKPVEPKPVEHKPATVATKPVEQTPIEQKPVEPAPTVQAPSEPTRIDFGRSEFTGSPTLIGSESSRGWYTDPLTDVLLGVGVAGGVAGVVFYRKATSDLDHADKAATYSAQQSLVDQAHSARLYAIVAGAGGVALAGIAVVRIVTHHDTVLDPRYIAVAPVAGGGLVTFAGRF